MKKITALYERSGNKDVEQIRHQQEMLESYAAGNGFTNIQHFTDDGFSASDHDRRGFAALQSAIQAGKIGIIIVQDMARISVDEAVISTFKATLQEKGVRLISIMDKIDILPEHIHDDENGLDYTLHGDYYFPDLILRGAEDRRSLGKWGLMRRDYLRKNRPVLYSTLLLNGTLHTHLADLDEQARERHELVVRQMAQAEGVNEHLKMRDQMEWVGRMNAISSAVDEIIMAELICA